MVWGLELGVGGCRVEWGLGVKENIKVGLNVKDERGEGDRYPSRSRMLLHVPVTWLTPT